MRMRPDERVELGLKALDLVAAEWIAADGKVAVLAEDLHAKSPEPAVAYRGAHRWALGYEPVALAAIDNPAAGLRDRGPVRRPLPEYPPPLAAPRLRRQRPLLHLTRLGPRRGSAASQFDVAAPGSRR